MSAGKHTVYKKKIVSSDGLGKPIMIGGGDGTPTSNAGPIAHLDGYHALSSGSATLTARQHGGTIVSGAAATYTCLTGSELDAAFPNLPVGATWDLWVMSTSGTATLAGATGVTLNGDGAVVVNEQSVFRFVKTAAATYLVGRAHGA